MDSLIFDGRSRDSRKRSGARPSGGVPARKDRNAPLRREGPQRTFCKWPAGDAAVSWQVREFEKLQAELSETISSTLNEAAKNLEGGSVGRRD